MKASELLQRIKLNRFGLGKYESLGVVYELDDYKTPSDDLVRRLQAIIDEAFGRGCQKD
jgi:pyruvate formate lyase activating enzyme